MPCFISGVMLRRSARYFCLSRSISGSVRQGCPCASQYVFHASESLSVGRGGKETCVPSSSLIVAPLPSKGPLSLSSIAVFEQRELEKDQALLLVASAVGLCAQDHIPFHRTGWPQLQLRTLIGMVVQAWIADAPQMLLVGLPLDRVT